MEADQGRSRSTAQQMMQQIALYISITYYVIIYILHCIVCTSMSRWQMHAGTFMRLVTSGPRLRLISANGRQLIRDLNRC
jgi:hypothetical protein